MTLKQKLEAARKREIVQRKEALEIREKLPNLEGEAQAEAVAELHEVERRALATAEEVADLQSSVSSDPQSREGAVLEARSVFGQGYLQRALAAAIDGPALTGAELEYHAEHGIGSSHISLRALQLPIEHRNVTPGVANVQVAARETALPVFHGGDASFLGIAPDMVAAGRTSYPVLTTKPTVAGPHDDSTSVDDTTGAFTANILAPQRFQAEFFARQSDLLAFGDMGPALERALRAGLGEAYDAQVVKQISADVSDTTAAGADTFATIASRFIHGAVDGTYARQATDVRLLIGSLTYADWAALANATTQETGVELAARLSGGIRVSPNVPAATASNAKQLTVARLGLRSEDFAAAVWENVEILRDPFTKSATGEVRLIAQMFGVTKTLRTAAFRQVQAQFK